MRSADRMKCNILAKLVNGAEQYEITILNCSRVGLLVWCLTDIPADTGVDIEMQEIGGRRARVAWFKDHFGGIEFIDGLRPSELLALRRQSTVSQNKPKPQTGGRRSLSKRVSRFIPRCTFLR
jgi:hypothetical protein